MARQYKSSPARSNHVQRSTQRTRAVHSTPPAARLQQTIGNRAVGRMVQAKLKVGAPDDKYEQEADRVAEQVVSMPEPSSGQASAVSHAAPITSIQRKPTTDDEKRVLQGPHELAKGPHEEEEGVVRRTHIKKEEDDDKLRRQPEKDEEDDEKKMLQAKVGDGGVRVSNQTQSQIDNLKGGGQPLSENTRSFFESRLGEDLSHVRVHTDPTAAETANSINARAFTVGSDVAFGAGEYVPETNAGKRLLAHELTHVVQQDANQQNSNIDSTIKSKSSKRIQRVSIGTRFAHPSGVRSPYRRVEAEFDGREFIVKGDGTEIMRVAAESGKPISVLAVHATDCGGSTNDSYLNNPRYVGIRDYGAIPEGEFTFRATQIATFSLAEQARMISGGHFTDPFGRALHGGDWGAGRVPLTKDSVRRSRICGNTNTRSGFYIHGGVLGGSAGCIDIGNSGFDRLVALLAGFRGEIRVKVEYRHPAPSVGSVGRAIGRFTYPETHGAEPTLEDRVKSLLGL